MRPLLPQHDFADGGLVHAVSLRNGCLGHAWPHGSDVPDILFGKFGVRVSGTKDVTTLQPLVFVVLCDRASRQVGRIAAGRVVAGVQHVLSLWNRAVREFVGHAMGAQLSAVIVGNHAISTAIDGTGPRPTGVGRSWLEKIVEAFAEWTFPRRVAARLGAERVTKAADRSELALAAWRARFAWASDWHGVSLTHSVHGQ